MQSSTNLVRYTQTIQQLACAMLARNRFEDRQCKTRDRMDDCHSWMDVEMMCRVVKQLLGLLIQSVSSATFSAPLCRKQQGSDSASMHLDTVFKDRSNQAEGSVTEMISKTRMVNDPGDMNRSRKWPDEILRYPPYPRCESMFTTSTDDPSCLIHINKIGRDQIQCYDPRRHIYTT